MSTNHLSIKDSTTTLGDGGVTFLEMSFTAPGHDAASRPVILYQVYPSVVPVEFQIDLNGTVIENQTFSAKVTRMLAEILPDGLLNAGDNTLIVSRVGNTGSFDFSKIVMFYSVPS